MNAYTSYTEQDRRRCGEHILIRLTYIGTTPKDYTALGLTRDLEHWRRYNQENGITSALAINETYSIHSIEGSRPDINNALAKLMTEYIQVVPHIVQAEEIAARKWGYYWLKYLTHSVEDEEYTLKALSAGADFNPYLMNSSQLTNFLALLFEQQDTLAQA